MCFGAPSVFEAISQNAKKVCLVDRNRYLLNCLNAREGKRVRSFDLRQTIQESSSYEVLFMDPPWYPEHMEAWLDNSLRCLNPNGTLITTLLPIFTRPEAETERKQFLELLKTIGHVTSSPVSATYETPIFEQETLRAQDLNVLAWRTADLLTIKLNGSKLPRILMPKLEEPWRRYKIGSQIIAIRESTTDTSPVLTAKSCYEDGKFLLASVSARDPIRARIDFWTSRNRCLQLTGRHRLFPLLDSLEKGHTPSYLLSTIPRDADERTTMTFVLALIGI